MRYFVLLSLTGQRLLLASRVVVAEGLSDQCLAISDYARLGGVGIREIRNLGCELFPEG